MERIEALAKALADLNWNASVTYGRLGYPIVKVAEYPSLRTPEVRRDGYVWDGYWAKRPETMARRLDAFIRERGAVPASEA